jgi:cytochrome c oxidase cbb3-type subunit 1
MITMGCVYALVPKLWGKERMYSIRLIDIHFWIATIGIVLYIAAMWMAGVMQGLMWRAVNADGTLTYSFMESIKQTYPFYTVRFLGGVMFLVGMLIMAYNVFKTIGSGKSIQAQPVPQSA